MKNKNHYFSTMPLVELTKTELDIINKIRYSIKKGDTYIL